MNLLSIEDAPVRKRTFPGIPMEGPQEEVEKEFSMPGNATTGLQDYDLEGQGRKKPGRGASKVRGKKRHAKALGATDELPDGDEMKKVDITEFDESQLQKFFDANKVVITSGELVKGVYDVAQLGQLVSQLKCMADGAAVERQIEGDDSSIPEDLRDAAANLLSILSDMASEESEEIKDGSTAEDVLRDTQPTMTPGLYRSDIGDLAKAMRVSLFGTDDVDALAKAGARNSKKDLETLQKCHDALCELGASCKTPSPHDMDGDSVSLPNVAKGGPGSGPHPGSGKDKNAYEKHSANASEHADKARSSAEKAQANGNADKSAMRATEKAGAATSKALKENTARAHISAMNAHQNAYGEHRDSSNKTANFHDKAAQSHYEAAQALGYSKSDGVDFTKGYSTNSEEENLMGSVNKGDTVMVEGNKRGSAVTDPKPGQQSSKAEDLEIVADQGQEKPNSSAKKSKKRMDEDAVKRKKMQADEDEDDDEDEDEDDMDDDSDDDEDEDKPAKKKAKKAKKSFSIEDLSKAMATAVAAGVAQAMEQLGKSSGGGEVTIPRVAPKLMSVGKDGVHKSVEVNLDELRKSVSPAQVNPIANWTQDKDSGKMVGDNDTATLIKAIHKSGSFRLSPMDIPN